MSEYYDVETARSGSRAELLNLKERVRRVSKKQHKHGWCYGSRNGGLNRGAKLDEENSDLLDSYSRIYLILGWGQETVVVLGYQRKEGDVIPLSALISCATESALRCNIFGEKGCIVFASTRMRKLKLETVFGIER